MAESDNKLPSRVDDREQATLTNNENRLYAPMASMATEGKRKAIEISDGSAGSKGIKDREQMIVDVSLKLEF